LPTWFSARHSTCFALISIGALLSGCAVGPDFVKPTAPLEAGYAPTKLPQSSVGVVARGGVAQNFVSGQTLSYDWWTQFGSTSLNGLVEQAIRNNPSLPAAQAALRQAQEMVTAQQGYFFPTITGGYNLERQQVAGNQGSSTPGPQGNGKNISPSAPAAPTIYNMHTAQLTVGFVPDVFGANRRQVESLEAQAEIQRYALQATYVTLAANVVAAAIQEAETRDQITAVQAIIAANERSVAIVKAQQRSGYVMAIDVAAAEAALAQSRQLLPPLDKQLAQTRDLLRALVGNLPSQEIPEISDLGQLHLPTDLPVSLPSQIIEQRPDVRAAEEQWQSASAEVGVAIAARLPQFSITGAGGGVASQFGQMFKGGGPFWNVVGDMSLPIFDGNSLLHKERGADQALLQAAAQYRGTVLAAYQNVADALHAILSDADTFKAASQAEQAAKITLDLTRRQNQAGYVDVLTLLSADMAYQQTQLALVQAEAARFGDTAALYQALGGGWWNRPTLASDDTAGDPLLDLLR
jgi:NodT family efflux transporter outer membrane factor (OMF) lipoprotein